MKGKQYFSTIKNYSKRKTIFWAINLVWHETIGSGYTIWRPKSHFTFSFFTTLLFFLVFRNSVMPDERANFRDIGDGPKFLHELSLNEIFTDIGNNNIEVVTLFLCWSGQKLN